ncbi:MAG TPA: dual specificity protein phosphatase family protein [Candidatus Sabulitectum sp.]|nr:dual specificity protein phosphatase family protein [Candidatus Sabulitectum sp.]HPF31476.1 dual specificity protein phosphatase family protein [Candidatus Sabulitectum sp.]HPJ29224.1 dual specificity protein phosphatase family protein [Candidatus Sabulitectum sp.]HPR22952.1 dual specificity protein phosphatase family protein [Candidatus Sabulitectum sp.]
MKWWIDEPKLMGSHNPKQSELKIKDLSLIISLIDPRESSLKYNPAIPGVKWTEIPVRDFTAPSMDNLKLFIKLVEETPGTVLVHCEGGNGRTGTFGAAWLMRNGDLTAANALEILRSRNPEAVETDEQESLLGRFQKAARKFVN